MIRKQAQRAAGLVDHVSSSAHVLSFNAETDDEGDVRLEIVVAEPYDRSARPGRWRRLIYIIDRDGGVSGEFEEEAA